LRREIEWTLGWEWGFAVLGIGFGFGYAGGLVAGVTGWIVPLAIAAYKVAQVALAPCAESYRLTVSEAGVEIYRDGRPVARREGAWMTDGWVVIRTPHRVLPIRARHLSGQDFAALRRALKRARSSDVG